VRDEHWASHSHSVAHSLLRFLCFSIDRGIFIFCDHPLKVSSSPFSGRWARWPLHHRRVPSWRTGPPHWWIHCLAYSITLQFIFIALNHHYILKGLNWPNMYDTPLTQALKGQEKLP
jgi:hypothetical protein